APPCPTRARGPRPCESAGRRPIDADRRPRRRARPAVVPPGRAFRTRAMPVNTRMSRSQVRRNARKLSRYGIEPTVVIGNDLDLGPVAAVLIARWLYRYRSELAPVVVAAATSLAAWVLHRWHQHWWSIVAALAGVAVLGLAFVGQRIGLATRGERLYATA